MVEPSTTWPLWEASVCPLLGFPSGVGGASSGGDLEGELYVAGSECNGDCNRMRPSHTPRLPNGCATRVLRPFETARAKSAASTDQKVWGSNPTGSQSAVSRDTVGRCGGPSRRGQKPGALRLVRGPRCHRLRVVLGLPGATVCVLEGDLALGRAH
jgi:hypothetical protein